MITSTSNKKIKDVRELMKKASERKARGLFVVEGIKMFMELPDEMIQEVYVNESFMRCCPTEARVKLKFLPHETVTDTVFEYMSDTKSPQGILALVKMQDYSDILEKRTSKPGLDVPFSKNDTTRPGLDVLSSFLLLDRLQDPGNLGTIFRTAEAAGIDCIIMNRETVDIYNPKVVRSTMGAILRVPFIYVDDLGKTIESLQGMGVKVYAAHLKGKNYYDQEDYTTPTAFIIGNESAGISDEIAMKADTLIRIPMAGQVESLNASMAAGIMMYELSRQRRNS